MVKAFISKLSQLIRFLKSAFAEQDGLASMSRITAFVTTIAVVFWVTFVVLHTGVLPDLTSAALFLGAGTGGYAANKVSSMFGKGD